MNASCCIKPIASYIISTFRSLLEGENCAIVVEVIRGIALYTCSRTTLTPIRRNHLSRLSFATILRSYFTHSKPLNFSRSTTNAAWHFVVLLLKSCVAAQSIFAWLSFSSIFFPTSSHPVSYLLARQAERRLPPDTLQESLSLNLPTLGISVTDIIHHYWQTCILVHHALDTSRNAVISFLQGRKQDALRGMDHCISYW